MNAIELLDIIGTGETSKVQFKREISNDDSIVAEMIAMSNARGGIVLFGVEDKTGNIVGLDFDRLQAYNNRLATIASDRVKPQVFIYTEVVTVSSDDGGKKVLVVEIPEGTAKPYKDRSGIIWVKQGADKRKLTDNHEQVRLFQQSGIIYLDEMVVPNTSIEDVDFSKVKKHIETIQKGETGETIEITDRLLNNLNVIKEGRTTLGGLLFFAKKPQKHRSAFCIKAVSFFGNSIGGTEYRSSLDIIGTIPEMFEDGMRFLLSNLRHVQAGQNFNSIGRLEVSQIALEEMLQNALVHRDYSKNAPIRMMIFDDRIEIVSPGLLPNSLTVENIKMGNAVVRNNLLVSYCSKSMNYREFGSGITRALENQPDLELVNDVEGELFRVVIPRPVKQ